jgi:hypothetical protein
MYGMVNRAIEEMVTAGHGEAVWERIKARAGVDVEVFVSNEGYEDSLTYGLVGAASAELGVPAEQILEAFGVHWVLQTAQKGYGDLMSSGGDTFREFILNLPNFHARLSMIFPHLQPPEFACSEVDPRTLLLHYRSHRAGLAPFVRGLIVGLGQMFETTVEVSQTADKSSGADHDEFILRW